MTTDGSSHANVRFDALKELSRDVTGVGVALTYEIIYTQLGETNGHATCA